MQIRAMSYAIGLIVGTVSPAFANDSVLEATKNPANWAMQQGDYSNQRYSKLDQINTSNVGNLQTSWSFSTGVLRGHEGSPLVIGNLMYVHTPFPTWFLRLISTTTALEIFAQAGSDSRAGHVLRHGEPRRPIRRRQDLPLPS